MIGLAGAHRVGKTTLAIEFAKKHDLEFIKTDASSVFKKRGITPKDTLHPEIRLNVQEEILKTLRDQYLSVDGNLRITDRTPIDMMAYTIANLSNAIMDDDMQKRYFKYLKDCIDLTNQMFSVIVVVQPGIPIIDEPDKAPANEAYIDHLSHLIMGLTVGERIKVDHYYIPRYMTDIERRIEAVEFAMNRTLERHDRFLKTAAESGRPIIPH